MDPLDGTREYGSRAAPTGRCTSRSGSAAAGSPTPRWPSPRSGRRTRPEPAALAATNGERSILVSDSRPPAWAAGVAEALGARLQPMGSAGAKAMAVLRGEHDAYVHDGGQWEWDSAAPVGVALAHGLHASRIDGAPLEYNRRAPVPAGSRDLPPGTGRRGAGRDRGLDGARRRPDRGRRAVRDRRRAPPAGPAAAQDVRDLRGARGDRRDVGPVPLSRACARTRDMQTLGYRFRPWMESRRRSPTGRRSSSYVRRHRARGGDRPARALRPSRVTRAAWADGRWTVTVRGPRADHLRLPLRLRRLLPLRRGLPARSSRTSSASTGEIDPPAVLARGPRLRGQARRGRSAAARPR